ncbi:hypothetical protein JCM4814A_14280 [Streptomyces phaeofaciens JCM 4814]|uniref:Uncharacterized protein n=1 Tax=Streptomyces phaeofaciens TaxID=68254 RepID=A0A918HMX2_9ACTN|nr:hypothetical protein [Streptomyces phaeofaciens]GGT74923.1 hypothetical protein GCM10010226_61190 [Streptomyces phaeofaciens]
MKLRAEHRTLRFGVWDNDPTPPRPPRQTPWDAESGRGLGLVRTCSDSWGWVRQPDHRRLVGTGKYIWCDLTNTAV